MGSRPRKDFTQAGSVRTLNPVGWGGFNQVVYECKARNLALFTYVDRIWAPPQGFARLCEMRIAEQSLPHFPFRCQQPKTVGKVNEVMSIFQVAVKGSLGTGIQLRNIHHYEFFGYTPDATILQEFVDNLDAAYKTNLQALFANEVTVRAYDVRRVDVGNLPAVEFVPTAGAWSGTETANNYPAQVSVLVTFKAPTAYPRTTRTYLFPMSVDQATINGDPAAGTITACNAWADAMFTIDVTGAIDPDKVAVKYGGDPRVVIDSNDVLTRIVNPVYSTLRSRKPGVGI